MKCGEIRKAIEERYPREAALGFDNVGLLVGRNSKEVQTVFLALDATENVIHQAKQEEADMLITHHPLIFHPLKQVTDEDFTGRRVLELIQMDIAYYAVHTNYDVLGMAQLAEKVLELHNTQVLDVTMERDKKPEGIGRVGELEAPMSLRAYCSDVKQKLNIPYVNVFGNLDREVRRVAVSPGSGKSAIACAVKKGADVLVTGDIGHHEGLDAVEQGLAVMDAGHYGTEYLFVEDMARYLRGCFPELIIKTAPADPPFQTL